MSSNAEKNHLLNALKKNVERAWSIAHSSGRDALVLSDREIHATHTRLQPRDRWDARVDRVLATLPSGIDKDTVTVVRCTQHRHGRRIRPGFPPFTAVAVSIGSGASGLLVLLKAE